MLTAMACCPLPTGRVGHGSAPRRVTEASVSALRRYREGAQVVETRGAADPVACATILLVCFSFTLLVPTARSAPPPRAACRSIRPLCVLTAYLPVCVASCLVAAVRRCKGGDGRGEAYEGDGASSASLTACLADAFLLSFCCCCWLLCSTSMATAWTTARRPAASFQVT